MRRTLVVAVAVGLVVAVVWLRRGRIARALGRR